MRKKISNETKTIKRSLKNISETIKSYLYDPTVECIFLETDCSTVVIKRKKNTYLKTDRNKIIFSTEDITVKLGYRSVKNINILSEGIHDTIEVL